MARPDNPNRISMKTSAPNYQRVARNANANEAAVITQGGAFVILDQGDVVISNDSVTAPMWSSNNPNLTNFYTSSTQISSNVQEYYTSIFQTASTETSAEIQFDIAYSDQVGSGSQFLNNLVTGSTPTRTNYGQYRNLVLGDENAAFIFGGVTSSYFYALPLERARYKQTILPGTWTLKLQGYNATTVTTAITTNLVPTAPLPTTYAAQTGLAVTQGNVYWFESDGVTADTAFQAYWDALGGSPTVTVVVSATLGVTSLTFSAAIGNNTNPLKAGSVIKLDNAMSGITDDIFLRVSKYWMAGTSEIQLTDDSKVNTTTQFCDAGRIYQIISGSAGVVNTSLGNVNGYTSLSGSYGFMLPDINTLILNGEALDSVPQGGGINFGTSRSFDSKGDNSLQLVDSLNNGGQFTINSQEDLSSDYIFCRAKNSEYNYSANPSFISSSTGAVVFPEFVENPTTYITTVGLYNISQELLAVAKLSRPLEKNFTKELLVRVKLDF